MRLFVPKVCRFPYNWQFHIFLSQQCYSDGHDGVREQSRATKISLEMVHLKQLTFDGLLLSLVFDQLVLIIIKITYKV